MVYSLLGHVEEIMLLALIHVDLTFIRFFLG